MQHSKCVVTVWTCGCGRRYKTIGDADVCTLTLDSSLVVCTSCNHEKTIPGVLLNRLEEVREGVWVAIC